MKISLCSATLKRILRMRMLVVERVEQVSNGNDWLMISSRNMSVE